MAVELQWDKEVAHDSCEVGLGGCSVCWLREVLRRYDVRPSRGVCLPSWGMFIKQLGSQFMNGGYSAGVFASPDEYLVGFFQLAQTGLSDDPTVRTIANDLRGLFIEEKFCRSPACSSPTSSFHSSTYRWEVSLQEPGSSLAEKLQSLMRYQLMSVSSDCTCGARTVRKTREYFLQYPNLLIALKRYVYVADGRGVRVSQEQVSIQESLELEASDAPWPTTFKLTALICQSNSHCWAYVRRDEQWFVVDDTKVEQASLTSSHGTWTLAFFQRQGA